MQFPQIGIGTWELQGDVCTKIVQEALAIGYRHIDTAHMYQNHAAIAEAIRAIDRRSIYITSKIAIEEEVDSKKVEASVQLACEKVLKELGTDFLDLYLIHAPNREFPLEEIFGAMDKLARQGKIGKAGVSNYTIHHLQDLQKAGLVPFANQVEIHPYLAQEELVRYCQTQKIEVIAYRPFGKGKLLGQEPLLHQIGERHGKSGAQVALRWLIQRGLSVIPKGSSDVHLRENFAIFDFSLSEEEMRSLNRLDRGKRFCRADDTEFLY